MTQLRNLIPDPNGLLANQWTINENARPFSKDTRGLHVERAADGGEAYMESSLMPCTAGTVYVFAGDISVAGDESTGTGQVFRPIWRGADGKPLPDTNPFTGGASLRPSRRAIGELTAPAGATLMTLRVHAPITTGKAYILNRILVMSKSDYTALQAEGLDFVAKSTRPITGGGVSKCLPADGAIDVKFRGKAGEETVTAFYFTRIVSAGEDEAFFDMETQPIIHFQ